MLDFLVGNPAAVRAMAETWVNIQGQIETAQSDLTSAVDSALDGWTGAAADAYRAMSDLFAGVMGGVAAGAAGVATSLQGASAIIELVRTIVVQLISTLVGSLISYVVTALATVGFGAPAIVGQATIKIADTSTKAGKWTDDLVSTITKVSEFVQDMNKQFEIASPIVARAGDKLSVLSARDLVGDARQFLDNVRAEPGTAS
jgi:uncharacterized protein YukE